MCIKVRVVEDFKGGKMVQEIRCRPWVIIDSNYETYIYCGTAILKNKLPINGRLTYLMEGHVVRLHSFLKQVTHVTD
jgi:hypothetical protein